MPNYIIEKKIFANNLKDAIRKEKDASIVSIVELRENILPPPPLPSTTAIGFEACKIKD